MKLPDWLILWVWQALLGEIYPEIRAIALRFDPYRNLLVRYYLDREPTDEDFERIEYVITSIFANTSSNEEIRSVEEEAIYTLENLANLDALDGFIYARREYSE